MAMLADPTNVGNAPGDGPLRAGGVEYESPPRSDGDLPSTMSPAARRQKDALMLCRHVSGGTDTLRMHSTAYLPKAAAEHSDDYSNRLGRSVFYNAFRRAVDGMSGLVFSRDPELGDDVPGVIREQWENIDNAGTHGDVFVRDLFADALEAGHAAILVEFPATDGEQTADAELTGEVRPYWVPIKKDNILSWRTRNVNGKTVLAQLVVRECVTVPDGAFGEKEVERYRVFYVDILGVHWQLLGIDEQRRVFVYDEGDYPTQDEIPVAEVQTAGKRSMFESDPPLKDLAFLNVAHYQMWSDYNWSIHKTCVPFIFGSGIVNATDDAGNRLPLDIGPNAAVLQPNAEASMQYVSHSGEALGSIKTALDDLKNDMGSLALAMLAPQKRAAETAEAKRLDKATSDSALSVTARGLQDAVERALYFHARYLNLPDGGSIEINRDFEGLLMDAPVMGAFATLVQAGFPPRPVLEALQQGGRIADDADLDALEMEWLMGVRAKQAAAEAMAEGFGGGGGPDDEDETDDAVNVERDGDGRVTRLVRARRSA